MATEVRQLAAKVRHYRDMSGTYLRGSYLARQYRDCFEDLASYCCFIGYPRSGHSLVGSLLNAHPNVVVAHELDVLRLVQSRLSRRQILSLILDRDRWFADKGRTWSGYDYSIDEQWQGRFDKLEVIGDKKAGGSIRHLRRHPEALERLRATVRLPLRLLHVVRNPYDNISTMARRSGTTLRQAMDAYFSLVRTVGDVRRQLQPGELLDLRLESLVANPTLRLAEACAFLGVPAPEGYLAACAAVVFDSPRRSRLDAPWTDELIEQVRELAAGYDFLAGYRFDD